jgi:hypothetical protein
VAVMAAALLAVLASEGIVVVDAGLFWCYLSGCCGGYSPCSLFLML